ncbi:MAG: hypothetical protein Q8910_19160 [Bacteroidota bacterium]|nr:hypothetical protein [Bacteroidota bacterium]
MLAGDPCMEKRAGIILPLLILGTKNSSIEEEIAAYRKDHPHTRVIVLYRKDRREEVSAPTLP